VKLSRIIRVGITKYNKSKYCQKKLSIHVVFSIQLLIENTQQVKNKVNSFVAKLHVRLLNKL